MDGSNNLTDCYCPSRLLRSGLAMTLYATFFTSRRWPETVVESEPPYSSYIFLGQGEVPLFAWFAIPPDAKATLIATYGITGCLEDQASLRVWARKAYAQGYAVVLFDWRAHGQSAVLSPTLLSDGIHEGPDFVYIAAQAIALGCPPQLCFSGYSLGGQLALWGLKAAEDPELRKSAGLDAEVPVTGVLVCPNLDAWRSLNYLMEHPSGRYLEKAIARALKRLAETLLDAHPEHLAPAAIERIDSILAFDRELVIEPLGFDCVEDYYAATSPLNFMAELRSPHLVLYAADDPLFHPALVDELRQLEAISPQMTLVLTRYGGHVGYLSDRATQRQSGDLDAWWAWNRALHWLEHQYPA